MKRAIPKILLHIGLLIIFICVCSLHAQPWIPNYDHAPFQYGTVLNGDDSYWQKTAPTGCDLNGSETLANQH